MARAKEWERVKFWDFVSQSVECAPSRNHLVEDASRRNRPHPGTWCWVRRCFWSHNGPVTWVRLDVHRKSIYILKKNQRERTRGCYSWSRNVDEDRAEMVFSLRWENVRQLGFLVLDSISHNLLNHSLNWEFTILVLGEKLIESVSQPQRL